MHGWLHTTLGEVLTLQRGFDLPERMREEGEIPIVSSSGISGYHSEAKVAAPGVVTGRYGTLGEVFYLRDDFWPLNTTLWVKDFKGNHPRFVSYLLRTLNFARQNAAGAVPGVNRNALHLLAIRLPPRPIQERIASILAAYDDLIENNTRRIQILEDMAQRIYREWFVHFRFPGHQRVRMIPSNVGLIPDGWRPTRVGDLCDEVRRSVQPNEIDPETPYIGLEHLPRKSITVGEWGRAGEVGSTKLKFFRGEILFCKIRPYFHKVAVAPVDGVASSDALVIVPKAQEYFCPVLCCVSSEEFVRQATQTSQGTKMPRANWDVLTNYPLPLPPPELLEYFSAAVRPIVDLLGNLMSRNRILRATRDLLLPKLVSGEIPVDAAERCIDDRSTLVTQNG